jgi:hypothetical protein
MSTEQKPATTPTPPATHAAHATEAKHEPNALAQGLTNFWDNFKQGKLLSYPMMALILFVVAGVGVTWWIIRERRIAESARWADLDKRSTPSSLEEFAKANPNTIQAKLANLEIARLHLGQEGIDRMHAEPQIPGDPDSEKRAREIREAAVLNVEKARAEFQQCLSDFNHDPTIKVECLWSLAQAEAALVGIPKPGQLDQRRGDPAKAVEWYDKVAEAASDTPLGKQAKKMADTLRNQNTAQQVATLQASVFSLSPGLPDFTPKSPSPFAPPK